MKTYLVLILTTFVNISEGRFIDSLNIKSVENVMCYSGADQKCSKKRKEMRSFTEKKTQITTINFVLAITSGQLQSGTEGFEGY